MRSCASHVAMRSDAPRESAGGSAEPGRQAGILRSACTAITCESMGAAGTRPRRSTSRRVGRPDAQASRYLVSPPDLDDVSGVVLVDSCVLLDILTDDPVWGRWSAEALAAVGDRALVALNAVVYAEVSIGFTRIEELEEALPGEWVLRLPVPWEAAFLAGKCFLAYRRAGGTHSAPLPDFFIGAHAAVEDMPLLTRDAARYATYFPTVRLIAPAAGRSASPP